MIERVLHGYAADAPDLVIRYEALCSEQVLASVLDLLPGRPGRVLDIGAGTGRDAAWLAGRGHEVTAVEPVAAFRTAGTARHPELRWIDDRLPTLAAVRATGQQFDLVLLVGVWQHLPAELHPAAVAEISSVLARGARLILSLRHGQGAPSRPCFPAAPDRIVALAEAEGLRLLRRREAASLQPANRAAGVTWTWLAFAAQ